MAYTHIQYFFAHRKYGWAIFLGKVEKALNMRQ